MSYLVEGHGNQGRADVPNRDVQREHYAEGDQRHTMLPRHGLLLRARTRKVHYRAQPVTQHVERGGLHTAAKTEAAAAAGASAQPTPGVRKFFSTDKHIQEHQYDKFELHLYSTSSIHPPLLPHHVSFVAPSTTPNKSRKALSLHHEIPHQLSVIPNQCTTLHAPREDS